MPGIIQEPVKWLSYLLIKILATSFCDFFVLLLSYLLALNDYYDEVCRSVMCVVR